jgi:hypothetical protein
VNRSRQETNRWTSYTPISPGGFTGRSNSHKTVGTAFGKPVAEWLSQRQGKYKFLTGAGPSNDVMTQ